MVELELQQANLPEVNAVAKGGAVTLSGTTDTLAGKLRAEEVAMGLSEVARVSNEIRVGGVDLPDEELSRRVGYLMLNLGVDLTFTWIEARVTNGDVVLEGWMIERGDLETIFGRLSRMDGVKGLQSNIVLLDAGGEDQRIRDRAAQFVFRDSYFRRYAGEYNPPIHILVKDGVLVLRGEVENEAQRSKAEKLAGQAGATKVVNNLVVASGSG